MDLHNHSQHQRLVQIILQLYVTVTSTATQKWRTQNVAYIRNFHVHISLSSRRNFVITA